LRGDPFAASRGNVIEAQSGGYTAKREFTTAGPGIRSA